MLFSNLSSNFRFLMHAVQSHDAIQASRSELKFTVDEGLADSIRRYLGARLRPDPHSVAGGYPVCSVYLDSQDDRLLRQTNEGVRNRYKLRARIYDDHPGHPAFLEIKRRDGNAVKKQRARVDRSLAMAVLAGEPVADCQAALNRQGISSQKQWKAFSEFCRLRDSISAVGTTYVIYRREAFVSPANLDWRATFDRHLYASAYRPGTPLTIPTEKVAAENVKTVVFELKFTNRFPIWMRELVQAFNLLAGPYPKYVTCRERIKPRANPNRLNPMGKL